MKKERRLAYKVLQHAQKGEWDAWRKHYDDLSIDDLVFLNMGIDAFIKEQKCLVADGIIEILEKLYLLEGVRSLDVVELGCHRGGLACSVLKHFPKMIGSWAGYDINHYAVSNPIPDDSRYKGLKQTEWFYDLQINGSYDTFISTSTLEHHSRAQFLRIMEKLKNLSSIRYVIIGLPVRPSGWMGYRGSHILDMNQEEIAEALEDIGFDIFYYERKKVYLWGASR